MTKKTILLFLLTVLFIFPALAKEIPPELLAVKLQKHDPELFIHLDSVLKMQKEGKTVVFVDTRLETEFKKFHIPHSINIPLFAVKTKDFLKSSNLILFNEGYSYSQLEQECLNLRKTGFKAWIFNGGLNYWIQKGGAIEGNAFAGEELNKIPPEAFFLEKNYEGWIIIDIDDFKANDVEKQVSARLKKETEKHKEDPLFFILIFNKTGDKYEKIAEAVHKAGIANVFYLKGGLDGYREFLKNKEAKPVTRTSITSVGTTDTKTINKPCGSCQ